MSELKNLTGCEFGRLTVISYIEKRDGHHWWLCNCSCENKLVEICSKRLLSNTKSCGCLKKEQLEKFVKHKMTDSKEYQTWCNIKARCLNKTDKRYPKYGAIGIKICERWLNSFESFYEDMGPRPSPEHSIDRIDNDGDYTPENCRWATRTQQANNKSTTILIEYNGEKLTTEELSEITGLTTPTIRYRYNTGWSVEKIINTKFNKRNIPIEYNGKSQLLSEWSAELGLSYQLLAERLCDGWSIERAFSTPKGVKSYELPTYSNQKEKE